MRRKLAYILLASALIASSAAAIPASIVALDTDVSYGAGKELYFRISEKGTTTFGLENAEYITNDDYAAVNEVKDEFETRLESWDINANVTTEGYSTVKVTLRTQEGSEADYQYLQRYLPFSGGDITVAAGYTADLEGDPSSDADYLDNRMFEGQTATIEYVNNIPVVAIPVNYPGEDGKMATLVDFCSENTIAPTSDSSTSTAGQDCYLVFWNNFQEGDNFADAYDSSSENYDPNMAARLIFGEVPGNAWFNEDDEDDQYTRIQLLPNSEAIQDGTFNQSLSGSAYKAARYYCSLFNASSYDYDITFSYMVDAPAQVESLIDAGDYHLTPAMGATLVATLVGFFVSVAILVAFYRLSSLMAIANAMATVLLSLLLFGYFAAQFGIGAVVGLLLGALLSLFGSTYYLAKLKQGLYSGRSPKKAHYEALKKALWPTLDAGIVSILMGLCVYGFVPGVIGKAGLMLVLSGAIGMVLNLVLTRLEGYMLACDNSTEKKLGATYGIDESKLPNNVEEMKEPYGGVFAKTDFKKFYKGSLIALAVLSVAAVLGLSIASGVTGEPYNYGGAYSDTTSISLAYQVEKTSTPLTAFDTPDEIEDNFLAHLKVGDAALAYEDVVDSGETSFYDSVDRVYYNVYYYDVPLSAFYGDGTEEIEGVTYYANDVSYPSLAQAVEGLASEFDGLSASVNLVTSEEATPSLATFMLGYGVGYVFVLAYSLVRYRLARGSALTLVSFASGLVPMAIVSAARIAVTPVFSLAPIMASILVYLAGSYFFDRAEEIRHEARERDKSARSFKMECLLRANALEAGEVVTFAFLAAFSLIAFFGFGPGSFELIFLLALVGLLIGLYFVFFALVPLSNLLSDGYSLAGRGIKKALPEKKKEEKGPRGKKGSEPEEALFIGIND